MGLETIILNEAVRSTEQEIFDAGAGVEPKEDSGLDTSLEQIEGWDGKPLGDEEMLEANFRGRDNTGFDRPLQLAEETNEYETAVREAAALKAENAQLRTKYEPTIRGDAEAQRDQLRQSLIREALENPDGVLGHIETLRTSRTELDTGRVENSLRAAHEKYGPDFERIYNVLNVTRNPQHVNDPVARAIVQRIWGSPDPGEALMEWGGRGLVQSGRGEGRSAPPFMPQPERSAAPRSSRTEADDYSERGRSDFATAEAEIWRDVERY
jgi:hypothetical protein